MLCASICKINPIELEVTCILFEEAREVKVEIKGSCGIIHLGGGL